MYTSMFMAQKSSSNFPGVNPADTILLLRAAALTCRLLNLNQMSPCLNGGFRGEERKTVQAGS